MKKLAITLMTLTFTASAYSATAFFKYEYESGMNKICVYDSLSGDVAITIKGYKLCPLSIEV